MLHAKIHGFANEEPLGIMVGWHRPDPEKGLCPCDLDPLLAAQTLEDAGEYGWVWYVTEAGRVGAIRGDHVMSLEIGGGVRDLAALVQDLHDVPTNPLYATHEA